MGERRERGQREKEGVYHQGVRAVLSVLGQWGVHAACLWPGWVLACAAPAGLRLLGPRHRTRGERVLGQKDTGRGSSNRPDWGSRSGSDGWIGVAGAKWQGSGQGHRKARQVRGQQSQEAGRLEPVQRRGRAGQQTDSNEPLRAAPQLVFIPPAPPRVCPLTGNYWASPTFLCHPLVENSLRPGWRSPSTVSPTACLVWGAARRSLPREGLPSLLAASRKWQVYAPYPHMPPATLTTRAEAN